jgi:hypothetical protein
VVQIPVFSYIGVVATCVQIEGIVVGVAVAVDNKLYNWSDIIQIFPKEIDTVWNQFY